MKLVFSAKKTWFRSYCKYSLVLNSGRCLFELLAEWTPFFRFNECKCHYRAFKCTPAPFINKLKMCIQISWIEVVIVVFWFFWNFQHIIFFSSVVQTHTHTAITTENSCYAFVNSAPKFFCILSAFVTTSQNVEKGRKSEMEKKFHVVFICVFLCPNWPDCVIRMHIFMRVSQFRWHYVCKSNERDEFTNCDMNEHIKMDAEREWKKKIIIQQAAVTWIFPFHLIGFRIFLLEKSNSHYRFHLNDWPWKKIQWNVRN